MIARASVWLGMALVVGCRACPAEAGPQACAPVTSSLPADASAEALAGRYRLQLVASSGANKGGTAGGALQLLPYDSSERQRRLSSGVRDTVNSYPLYGSTDMNLEAVGAVAGDLGSVDPSRPGVLVIRMAPRSDTAGVRVILRLGAEANRQDLVRFDGGYTVLRVREITGDGFGGDWESGAPMPQAGGHFCAVRTAGTEE
jgi:hypothetical protein